MPSRFQAWYHRPAGVGEVLRVMIPLVISTSSWTILTFTDRLFLLWYSPDSLAASLPAGVLAFAVACFPLGLVLYVNTFVAQYHGAGRPERIGVAVWQAVFLALLCTPPIMATNLLAPGWFAGAGHEPAVAAQEVVYFTIMNYGAGAMLLSAALSSFFTGRGQTKVVMLVDLAAAVLNIVLDYAWIFGHWGFPEWGIAGAAWATIVSMWIKTAVYLGLFLQPAMQAKYRTLAACRWDEFLMRRLIRFGTPPGLQFLVEVGAFTAFLFLLGELGTLELTATSLAFNVNQLAFLPVYGAGIAAGTLVGQRLGDHQPRLAARAAWTAFAIGTIYMALFALVYVLLPDAVLYLHQDAMRHDVRQNVDWIPLRETTVVLLRFVAAYCLFDAMYAVLGGAIKGAGDTRFVLATATFWSGVTVLATWIGRRYYDIGLEACWTIITLWIAAMGVSYLVRFMGGKWQTMRVIEPELPDPDEPVPVRPLVETDPV